MADEMITIDASALSSFDYTSFIYDYFSSEVVGSTAGSSSYYGGVPYYGDTQVGFKYNGTTNNAQVLLEGSDIAYDGVLGASYGHGISGSVDGFTLGYYDENTASTVVDAETGEVSELEGVIAGLVVSGLDYSAAVGTGTGSDNLVYTLYNALRKANTLVDLDGDGTSGYEYIDLIYSLLGGKAQHFIGTSGADNYVGTDYGDLIEGGAGADTLAGGLGDDTYVLTDRANTIVEAEGEGTDTIKTAISHYLIRDNVENLVQTGEAGQFSYGNTLDNTMTATALGGYLYGQEGNDTLIGGAGNDTLDGGTGTDVMTGGAGNDTYYVDDNADVITEVDGGGTDKVATSLDNYVLADFFENLTLLGSDDDETADADLTGTGNSLANIIVGNDGANSLFGLGGADTIYGGEGNDTIDGGAGIDVMVGGAGNDSYIVDRKADAITEADGGGTDSVKASVGYTLGDFIENLRLTGSAKIIGKGNALDNIITGNSAANQLYGYEGDDVLKGGGGADKIRGGLGIDTLTGGNGADTFFFKAGETDAAKKTADTITDFRAQQGDLINVAGFDANEGKKGNQAFDFIGTDAFSGHAGELRFQKAAHDTYVMGDTDGDGTADFTIHLNGAFNLKEDFFVL